MAALCTGLGEVAPCLSTARSTGTGLIGPRRLFSTPREPDPQPLNSQNFFSSYFSGLVSKLTFRTKMVGEDALRYFQCQGLGKSSGFVSLIKTSFHQGLSAVWSEGQSVSLLLPSSCCFIVNSRARCLFTPTPYRRWVPSAQACGSESEAPRREVTCSLSQQAGWHDWGLSEAPSPAQRLTPKKTWAWKGVSCLGLSECTEGPPGGHHLLSFGLSRGSKLWGEVGWRRGRGCRWLPSSTPRMIPGSRPSSTI